MFRKSADTLLFGTGTPVRLRIGSQERVILDKDVRTEQIVKLLRPIAPTSMPIGEEGETRFQYEAPMGRVQVKATIRGDRMTAVVLPIRPGVDDVAEVVRHQHAPVEDDAPLDLMSNFVESAVDLAAAAQEAPPVIAMSAEPPDEGRRARRGGTPPPSPPPPPRPARAPEPAASIRTSSVAGEPEINAVLRDLVARGGSDLHLTSGERPRIRKDGDIAAMEAWNEPLTSDQIHRWMQEVAHDQARAAFEEANDADFAHEIADVARFRMNWFRDRNGVGAVMRTIPSKVLTADQLGLSPAIRKLCELPKGLVVVTGPTGSGKSTTLAAMIDLINKTRSDHIITIEDPVEFVHKSIRCLVNQREVHSHTKSFSAALRAALREDPDIVLVGELRDLETVHIAIETAETGHLVFGTLHTNTAASTVDRMIDQFPTDHQAQIRVMLSESLRGVVAQTLCKKKGGGRVACMEILIANNAISNLIREGKTFQIASIMQTNRGIGMQTQTDHMLRLVQEDTVDPKEAYRKAVDPTLMKQVLERAGFQVEDATA